jgi:SPX domain protein involved in polyphosphate accumulation
MDYKNLKQFIKSKLRDIYDIDSNREKVLPDNVHLNSPGESWDSRPNIIRNTSCRTSNEFITQFTGMLDSEIKKIYFFFQKKERELYVSINSHLHLRETFNTFNVYNIMKEYEELCNISDESKKLSKFINENMIALRHILYKFDKYFKQYCNKQSFNYIDRKIKAKNSDLLYILQFKVKYINIDY